MAAGNRDFATMLDELLAADEAARNAATRIGGIDFLAVMDELHSGRISIGGDAAEAYREQSADRQPERTAAAWSSPLPSLDPAEIARELGLNGARGPGDFDALRRRFAFSNHPDRVAPELRDRAEQRMRIANMLVDDAKKGRGRAA